MPIPSNNLTGLPIISEDPINFKIWAVPWPLYSLYIIEKISESDVYIFSKPFSVKYIGTSVKRARVLPIEPNM